MPKNQSLFDMCYAKVQIENGNNQNLDVLLNKDEQVEVKTNIEERLKAPLKKGAIVGNVTYLLDGEVLVEYPVVTIESVQKKNMTWYFIQLAKMYFSL